MKILTITGNRSDYDLMSPLYHLLHTDPAINLQLLVTGAHLSTTYGYSINQIKVDGYSIFGEIESLAASDTKQSRIITTSRLLAGAIEKVAQFNPDLILYVGDREEVIVGALLGCYLEIPTMHFWSGDHASDGNTDNAIRHAAAKLSSIQMVSLSQHKDRLLKMGEAERRVFNVGSIALDNFAKHVPFTKSEIKQQLGIKNGFDEFAIVIYHPVPAERDQYYQSFTDILESLIERNICAFINSPNSDPGNFDGLKAIDKYKQHPDFVYTKNSSRDMFLSIYKNAKFIIGNSSSGIVESASIPIPAVNVGERQKGRLAAKNVVFCGTDKSDIGGAIDQVTSPEFLDAITHIKNPYGDGHSAERAYKLIKSLDLRSFLYKSEDPLMMTNEMEHCYG